MHLLPLLTLLPLTLAVSSLTVTYTPLTQPQSTHPLAQLTLSPPHIHSFTPPPLSSSPSPFDPHFPIRISISTSSSAHTHSPSTLTTLSALNAPGGVFRLLLSPVDNSTISISYRAPSSAPTTSPNNVNVNVNGNGNGNGKEGNALPELEITYPSPPPRPLLNKPVVLNEEGKVEAPEVEKSLLQR